MLAYAMLDYALYRHQDHMPKLDSPLQSYMLLQVARELTSLCTMPQVEDEGTTARRTRVSSQCATFQCYIATPAYAMIMQLWSWSLNDAVCRGRPSTRMTA